MPDYGKYWDLFYQKFEGKRGGSPLWAVEPADSVATDLGIFSESLSGALPIIDLGCGRGEISAYLATHYSKVLGLDASGVAIDHARKNHGSENLVFEVLDATDIEAARLIHDLHGDCNLYMRGMLHQIRDVDIPKFQQVLSILMGKTGILYFIEVAESIKSFKEELISSEGQIPEPLKKVFISNLPPKGLSVNSLEKYFPKTSYRIISFGEGGLKTALNLLNGQQIIIPAIWGLIGPKE